MVKNIVLFGAAFFLFVGFAFGKANLQKQINDAEFKNAVGEWFSAWELICREVYGINELQPVEFVFFDDKFVYSTSKTTIAEGKIIKGPKLLGQSFVWKKSSHNGSITLPDKKTVPVGLMSFAAKAEGESGEAFFVMPLPEFWRKASVKSDELGLENLVTGVFLHEFSHSQQMRNFGERIAEFEKSNSLEKEISDNIVQEIFADDALYVAAYSKEADVFYAAAAADSKNKAAKNSLINNGLELLTKRHNKFFTGKYENLKQMDELFLTMEGLGQYTMYAWLTHKRGANLPYADVVKSVRRNKKWWSQDEGFALFLILERFSKPQNWAKKMFGSKTESVIDLIKQELKNK